MSVMASEINSLTIVFSTVYSVQIKENIKAPRRRRLNETRAWINNHTIVFYEMYLLIQQFYVDVIIYSRQ